jgi:hypothetical protein
VAGQEREDRARGGRPAGRVLLQALRDDALQARVGGAHRGREARRLGLAVLRLELLDRARIVEALAGERLVRDEAERVEVGLGRERPARQLLR